MKRPTKEDLLSLYTTGMNDTQVARKFKVNRSTVYQWRRHYGIQLTFQRRFFAQLHKGE